MQRLRHVPDKVDEKLQSLVGRGTREGGGRLQLLGKVVNRASIALFGK